MSFLNPLWLWGTLGAVGIAVPIIIHLLNKLRHRRTDWAAMEFLRKALLVRSRRIRLEDIWLLVLRCAVLALVAFALLRPTLSGSSAKLLGGGQSGVLIALDGSFSMAHGVGQSRFDRAKQRIDEILGTLAPGSPVTLVEMGLRPRILLRNVGYEKSHVNDTIAATKVLPEKLNLEPNLEEMEGLLAEIHAASKECYIISDAQVKSWEALSDKSRASLQTLGNLSKLFILSTGTDDRENLAITRFELASRVLRKGETVRYDAEIRNFGQRPVQEIAVTLSANDKAVDQRTLTRLDPGQSGVVSLYYNCTDAGEQRLTASLGADALSFDNARHVVAHVREQLRVLCIDGEPSPLPFQSDTDYIIAALLPKKNAANQSISVQRVTPDELTAQPFADCDVAIIANVSELPAEKTRALQTFVERGGGAIFFLGKRVNAPSFNAWAKAANLAPVELLEDTGDASAKNEGVAINAKASDHPLAQKIAALPPKIVDTPRVRRYFKSKLLPEGREILRIAGADAPLLAERQLGRGKVLLVTTTADREWTDLPVHPLFVIMLHESIASMSAQANERPFLVGEPLLLQLPGRSEQTVMTVKNPAGDKSEIALTERAGIPTLEFNRAELPGFYEIQAAGEPGITLMAANVDTSESDVRSLRGPAFSTALSGVPGIVLAEDGDLMRAITESRMGRELWTELLILALVLFVFESLLARRYSKVISADVAPVLTKMTAAELLSRKPEAVAK
ncbi:MAG TPA: BatA domain-containing protein [Planctomycetota bacterium]|nr:BatA domain-containing protein [Planctomycetota bacterium]